MRLTKFNEETGKYEYIAKPMEYVEYRALTLAALQKLGEFEDKMDQGVFERYSPADCLTPSETDQKGERNEHL